MLRNQDFLARMEIEFAKAHNIMSKKIADYNPSGIAFKESFEEAQDLWPNDPPGTAMLKYIWVFYTKHHKAIKKFVFDGHVESEEIGGRFYDAINFLCIMGVIVRHEHQALGDMVESSVSGTNIPHGHPDSFK